MEASLRSALRTLGVLGRTRTRIGRDLILLGGSIHLALADFGMWIEPRLALSERPGRRIRPWVGLAVVVLLVAGLLFVGEVGAWIIREAVPQREPRS